MTKKRKLEAQLSEASEPSEKQIAINNEVKQEVEYEEVEEEHEDDDDNDEEEENDNRMVVAATSGSGNLDDDDDEPIQDLLEPFSKEQLLNLLKEAAEKHHDVANRIREVADEDPVHRKIFVHGLGWDTKTETLIEAFKEYGEIEDCKAVFDKVSGKSKGYGFILFKSRSGARNALKQPQKKIGSRMTACQLASKGPVFGGNNPVAAAGASIAPAQHSNSEHTQKKIYVSNVGAELDPQKLLAFFSKFGEIEEGPLGLDKYTGRPKGFCLFVYKSAESAKKALEEPHKSFEGHILHCQKAIDGPKPGKPQQFNNNPRFQRNDNSGGYGTPAGHGHLMAGNQAGMGAPVQAMNPAIGQALTALLASQGGLASLSLLSSSLIMEKPRPRLLLLLVFFIYGVSPVISDGSDHRYKVGDDVPLYANKVGPFHNPSETYRYFDLPFCSSAPVKEKKEALGEVLNGDRLVTAPYKLEFLGEKNSQVACRKRLSREDVAQFRDVISKDYYFQMYYDDLPIWGFLGKVVKDGKSDPSEYKYYLFNHLQFEIFYNKDRVIEIIVRTDQSFLVDLTEDKEVEVDFTYTVRWKETEIPFEKRMEKYSLASSTPHHLEIHWFSIINSCVTVLLLTGFLATILMRVLKNDFVKYSHDEETADDQEETGWKLLHGDVFRFPKHKSLLAAALGSGTQLFTLAVFIFMLALVGVFYPYNRGALFTALVVIYALTSGIAGYTASSFYCQLEGTNWVRNVMLTGSLFCGPLLLTFSFLNTVAIVYQATAALPFGTIVVIFLIWALVTSPLLILGGIAGKNRKSEFQAPCRTTKYPREIPPMRWYRRTLPQMAMAGFLPFSAIYIELYYIFASVWGHRIYTIYSILSIVFLILVIVTAFITVALTYFQLAAEDHEWWWRSLLCGGSTGVFVYAYCLYYYYARSDMTGFMQTSFFFGYMACICYGFFLMLGAVGFRASLFFVRHIYRSIKCE